MGEMGVDSVSLIPPAKSKCPASVSFNAVSYPVLQVWMMVSKKQPSAGQVGWKGKCMLVQLVVRSVVCWSD